MLINTSGTVCTQTDTIKSESTKLMESQFLLQTCANTLFSSHDAMMSYLGGNRIRVAYQEMGEYAQAKVDLLCNFLGKTAFNNISYASDAEQIDEDAGRMAMGGKLS